jgi:hypothetical protein
MRGRCLRQVDGASVAYWKANLSFATLAAVVGYPVLTLPVGLTAAGLPVGVQVMYRRFGEEHLLAVGKVLEEVKARSSFVFLSLSFSLCFVFCPFVLSLFVHLWFSLLFLR